MSSNRCTVNTVAPDTAGNISVNTDNISPTAAKGFTPLVDAYLNASVSINALSDVDTAGGSAGEGLTYNSTSGNWEPSALPSGDISAGGSFDVKLRNPAYSTGYALYSPTPTRLLLYRRSTSQVDVRELPGSATGPYLGYVWTGAPFGSSVWPTGIKVKAGHYLAYWQMRPKFDGLNAVEVAIKNYTSGDYWSGRARFDPNDSTDSGPTNLRGCGSASINDQIGVEIVSGSMEHSDEVWAKYSNLILIQIA